MQLQNQIAQSRNTYRDLTREMNSFYATPRPDPQIAALKKQVAELSAELEQSRKKPDPLDYMERSYALASKYLGGQPQAQPQPGTTSEKSKDRAA